MKENIFVVKASGERELFSEEKLRRSLDRVKVPQTIADEIVSSIRDKLRDGMKVSEIYRRAFSILRRKQRTRAVGYSLKKAIFALGPSGYPFEQLVARILRSQGYSVETGIIVRGYCVKHEVDVSAQKDKRHIMVECKFHNRQGIKSDVRTALYVRARFEDILKMWQSQPTTTHKYHEAWLVTNTRLTLDAIQYANCVGMKVIGWDYPQKTGLQQLIDNVNIYPVTCLTSLSNTHKKQLISLGIVTSEELIEDRDILRSLNIGDKQAVRVLDEIRKLRG